MVQKGDGVQKLTPYYTLKSIFPKKVLEKNIGTRKLQKLPLLTNAN